MSARNRKFWSRDGDTVKLTLANVTETQADTFRRALAILETKNTPVWNCYGLHVSCELVF